ncbi:MAG: YdcF family protein [Bifidobacterium mongoliense]|uniref:YdcF family protein n=1 Tax=Bifidobacterium mongoliense TaxID=518643 RepID=UPI002F3510C3
MLDTLWSLVVLFIPMLFWGLLFLISFRREPRQFRNAIWFALFVLTAVGTLTLLALSLSAPSEPVQVALLIALVVLAILAPAAVILFLLINAVIVIRREGLSPSTALPGLLGLGLLAILVLDYVVLRGGTSRWLTYLMVLATLEMLWMVFTFAALLLYSTFYRMLPRKRRYDYIIIHGAGLQGERPTPLLQGRLDKAVQLWERQGRFGALIASGGKGDDEAISESEAMRRYLRDTHGVPDDAILTEDRSTTTFENLTFSKEIMDALSGTGRKAYRAALVTSDYHVFRACEYAHRIRLNADGVGSRTSGYYWPAAFIREFIAISRSHWWPYAVIALPVLIVALAR